MKKIILAALLVMSASASAQVVVAGKKTENVTLSFKSDVSVREVEVAASTVCIEGKLFAVAVQRDSSGKTSGVTMTQIFESNATGTMYHVDCKSKKEVVGSK